MEKNIYLVYWRMEKNIYIVSCIENILVNGVEYHIVSSIENILENRVEYLYSLQYREYTGEQSRVSI